VAHHAGARARPVYNIYNGYWFFARPAAEELRHDLRDVLHRCRPDWDIRTAEQRTAWAEVDWANLYRTEEHKAGVRRTGLIRAVEASEAADGW